SEAASESKKDKDGNSLPIALVVDDNPDLTEMLKFELENEFVVITASDGNDALKTIETVKPSIIVTDLMMPGMDGIELCRRLKSAPETVSIPIIILTAKHDLGIKIEGLTLGAEEYITKPFNLDVLRLRMNKLIQLTAKGATRPLMEPEPETIKITPLDEKLIEKAMKYVSDNIDSPKLSVEELSDYIGMSRVQLYKKIKQITGKTPIEFIRVIRLKRAAQLLRESQLNVSEVAYKTGFNSPKVFSKYFKEEFGILPSAYQDKEGSEYSDQRLTNNDEP
ncbi:MAG: response regulator, partial [Muribaculaceae bacterium]|nr:response regulator [Muribaculaceae bacterium]